MLILIRGLPGSGKSTAAKQLIELIGSEASPKTRKFAHLEADMFMVDGNNEYKFVPERLPQVHRICQEKTEHFLKENYTVVVSNTFTTRKELDPYYDIAKKVGVTVIQLVCTGDYKSIHNVPEITMQRMRDRWVDYGESESCIYEAIPKDGEKFCGNYFIPGETNKYRRFGTYAFDIYGNYIPNYRPAFQKKGTLL